MASVNGQASGTSGPDQDLVAQISAEQSQAATVAQRDDPEDISSGGINPVAMQAKLRAASAGGVRGAGGGFTFTPEEVDYQLAQCAQQLNDLRVDLQDAHRAEAAVCPPAPDEASTSQANAVRDLLTSTAAVIEADISYLAAWQDKLTQAKNNYLASDDLTAAEWSRQAGGMSA
jgi:hypothetical protein